AGSRTLPPAQPREDGARYGEPFFIKRRVSRIAAIAHRFKGLIDLAEGGLSHGGVSAALAEEHQRNPFTAKTRGPVEWHALSGSFLQRLAKGGDGLFELRRPSLALPEGAKRIAHIVLGRGPVEWHALARPFLQRLVKGGDGLFELRRPSLALPEGAKRIAQIVLRHGPIERHALAR